jgi:hypothetical protein
MNYASSADPQNAIHQRELGELLKLTVHRELAVAAAMDYCAEEGVSPPLEIVKEAASLILELLKREKAQNRGRAAGRIARYQQDLWDVERWDAVEAVRRIRQRVKRDIELRRVHGETQDNSRAMYHEERTVAWLRHHGTFACASMLLAGRDARVSAEAVRASHRRCRQRAGTGRTPDRYYIFDERFLRKLGFPHWIDRKRGTKLLPLYNLTP